MDIKKQIEEKEVELFDFIKKQSAMAISLLCQWDLHMQLLNLTQEREQQLLEKELTPMVHEFIEKHTPLHHLMMHYHPLMGVFNDCGQRRYYDYQHRKYAACEGSVCYWKEIRYSDFEKAGFERDFTKRVIEKLVSINKIKFKKGSGRGNKFTIFDPKEIKDLVEFKSKGVQFTQNGISYVDDESWIYDLYDDECMINRFNEIKEEYFSKIILGSELKDDVELEGNRF